MTFKQKFKQAISSYNFWTTLAGALALIASAIGKAFCVKIEEQIVTDIVMAVAGVLVAVGIVHKPADKTAETEQSSEDEGAGLQSDETHEDN